MNIVFGIPAIAGHERFDWGLGLAFGLNDNVTNHHHMLAVRDRFPQPEHHCANADRDVIIQLINMQQPSPGALS